MAPFLKYKLRGHFAMSMSEKIKEQYKKKVISVEDALKKIKSHSKIVSGLAAAEPKRLLQNLYSIKDRVEDVAVYTCLPMGNYDWFSKPDAEGHFVHNAWFFTPLLRKAPQVINTYVPNHLHWAAGDNILNVSEKGQFIYAGIATPPDKNGYMSLSLSATYEVEMVENADLVILEVSDKFPKTFGDVMIHMSQVDHIIEVDYEAPEIPIAPTNEKDIKMAEYIMPYIENGSTLQLGIGGVPNAVGKSLAKLKDIGIHTEMLTEGMVDLFEAGIINGAKKTLLPYKMVTAFVLGTKKLYEFVHENPGVAVMRGSWVNDPYVIAQNYKQISINASVEVDLTGQVCSESVGPKQISGTGGQSDTALGAQMSNGGKSFITLYSTASLKDASGQKQSVSKIVPMLQQGAGVTLHRSNVDYVVTEHGLVRLKGLSVKERAKKLISIAHPDFRAWLTEEAKKLQYI